MGRSSRTTSMAGCPDCNLQFHVVPNAVRHRDLTEKRCTQCGEVKPIEDFPWVTTNHETKTKGRRYYRYPHSFCRPCKNENHKKFAKASRDRVRAVVAEYLANASCTDCGEADPVVLEFDHVRGEKVESISNLIRKRKIELLEAEFEKCDIVCANCHKRRTAERIGGNWRSQLGVEEAREDK